jgi:hypothetical protein
VRGREAQQRGGELRRGVHLLFEHGVAVKQKLLAGEDGLRAHVHLFPGWTRDSREECNTHREQRGALQQAGQCVREGPPQRRLKCVACVWRV